MNVDNKPDNVADPKPAEEASSAPEVVEKPTEEVMQERMSEAREDLSKVSDLVPKEDQGSTADVTTQGSSSKDDVTNTIDLKELETSAGRKFENVEDFYKHYKNLYGRYGDQEIAKAMKAVETLSNLEKTTGKPVNEIGDLLASLAQTSSESEVQKPEEKTEPEVKSEKTETKEVKPSKPTQPDGEVSDRLAKLEYQSQKVDFEKKYPNAEFVENEVAAMAKEKDISWIEAFEGSPLKQLVDLKVKEESAKSPVVTPSSRVNIDYKNLEDLGLKVMSGRATDKDQLEFAKEYFKSRGRELK